MKPQNQYIAQLNHNGHFDCFWYSSNINWLFDDIRSEKAMNNVVAIFKVRLKP